MQNYENQGADFYTNGSAGHRNCTEVPRMKEVAFEKSASEPMVCNQPRLFTQYSCFKFERNDSSSLTVVCVCRGSL